VLVAQPAVTVLFNKQGFSQWLIVSGCKILENSGMSKAENTYSESRSGLRQLDTNAVIPVISIRQH